MYRGSDSISRCLDAGLGEDGEQTAPLLVGPDHSHRDRRGPQRAEILHRVAAASRHRVGPPVIDDEDGGLARDARDLAVEELVEDEIAEDHHTRPLEAADDVLHVIFHVRPSLARIHSTAPGRSCATKAGCAGAPGSRSRRSPAP